jgi:hypothetical protein
LRKLQTRLQKTRNCRPFQKKKKEEEESEPEISKISGFSSNLSSENSFTGSEVEEDQIFAQNDTVLDKKLDKNDPWQSCTHDTISPKWNGAVSPNFHKAPFGTSGNNVVSRPYQKAPLAPSPNDAVSRLHQKAPPTPLPNDVVSPTSTNDVVSFKVAPFLPHMQSDAISPLNGVGPRTLEGARKKQHSVVLMLCPYLDPT